MSAEPNRFVWEKGDVIIRPATKEEKELVAATKPKVARKRTKRRLR